jgi:hypothetical protein
LVASLQLCAAAGLVHLGVIALDGTKVATNAADRANRTLAKLEDEVQQILREAAETDQAEDHQHGRGRGDELPAQLASPGSRLARLQQAKVRLEAEAAERQRRYQQRVSELAVAARAKGKHPERPSSRDAVTRRPSPTPSPTPPTPTAAFSPPTTAGSRATTPRPSPAASR